MDLNDPNLSTGTYRLPAVDCSPSGVVHLGVLVFTRQQDGSYLREERWDEDF